MQENIHIMDILNYLYSLIKCTSLYKILDDFYI